VARMLVSMHLTDTYGFLCLAVHTNDVIHRDLTGVSSAILSRTTLRVPRSKKVAKFMSEGETTFGR